MTNVEKYHTDYPMDGMIKSKVLPCEISGEGELFISLDKCSSFGHGFLYIDKYGHENHIYMSYDAFHKLLGECVRWYR